MANFLIPRQKIVHHVTNRSVTVIECLKEHFQLTQDQAQSLLQLGGIYSNKLRLDENATLPQGTYLRVHLDPKRFSVSEIAWSDRVISQTEDYLVFNKPHGIPVHPTVDNQIENCLYQLKQSLKIPLYVTQRLDTAVGGLMVYAKNKEFQAWFNRELSLHKVEKKYSAVTYREPALGLATHYMEPSERAPRQLSLESRDEWQKCELTVEKINPIELSGKNLFECEIQLHTGRTHQIRAQLSAMGCPIIGDKLYGARMKANFLESSGEKIALFSHSLSWSENRFTLRPSWRKDQPRVT